MIIDLTGQTFGRLTVLHRINAPQGKKGPHWPCECACGNRRVVSAKRLREGRLKSCGCLASPKIELAGQTFSYLTVIQQAPAIGGETAWLCRCVCGTEKVVLSDRLRSGRTKSCGCRAAGRAMGFCKRLSGTPEHNSWKNMHYRCYGANTPNYHNYGGRGIKVNFTSFKQFFDEVGPRPAAGYSIDRINNEGHYEPGNVRWATWKQQANNKRPRKSTPAGLRRTHCSAGHELTLDNVYLGARGSRRCKLCAKLDEKRRAPQ